MRHLRGNHHPPEEHARRSFIGAAVRAVFLATDGSVSHQGGFVRDQFYLLHHAVPLCSHRIELQQQAIDLGLPLADAMGRSYPLIGSLFQSEDMMEGVRQAMQTLGIKNLTTLGITSSLRGEGRTTLALATALVLAEYGMETILLELDLAHPELCHRLGVSKYPGLLDVAEGRADVADAMHPFSPGVSIVPVGQMQGALHLEGSVAREFASKMAGSHSVKDLKTMWEECG